MKLTGQKELIASGVVIAFLVFGPKLDLSSPVIKVAALAAILYVWKFVSEILAVLLAIVFVTSLTHSAWEGMESGSAPKNCACPDGYTLSIATQKCVDDKDVTKTQDPRTGYVWDVASKSCKPSQPTVTAPLPPAAVSGGATTAAPASSGAPATSPTIPMTTGSAAAQTMLSTPPAPAAPTTATVTPGGSSSTPAPLH